jgi:hypothetical protein
MVWGEMMPQFFKKCIDKRSIFLLGVFLLLSMTACIANNVYDEQSNNDAVVNISSCSSVSNHQSICELYECSSCHLHELSQIQMPSINSHEIIFSWLSQYGGDFLQTEHDLRVAEFIHCFENVYTVTYNWPLSPLDLYDTIVLWPYDSSLLNFSIVTLNSMFYEEGLIISTLETLFTIDELSLDNAVVLNIDTGFIHYMYPRAAIIFTNEAGLQSRMFIELNMNDYGCSRYLLTNVDDYTIAEWR